MNTKNSLAGMALLASVLASAVGIAQAATEPTTAAPQIEQPTAKPKPATAPSRQKRKTGKRYSKTTLSAFKPLNAEQTQAPAEAAETSATQSPVLLHAQPVSDPLRQPLPLADESSRTAPFTLAPNAQGVLATDAAGAVEADRRANVGSDDRSAIRVSNPDALGQEAMPATDRIDNKPKTRSLVQTGPLKLKIKGEGVRATVQIPLEDPKP